MDLEDEIKEAIDTFDAISRIPNDVIHPTSIEYNIIKAMLRGVFDCGHCAGILTDEGHYYCKVWYIETNAKMFCAKYRERKEEWDEGL